MKNIKIIFIIVVHFMFVCSLFSKDIPKDVKIKEISFIKNSYYESESRSFSDYTWNPEYYNDLGRFYKDILIRKDIPGYNIPLILRGLIRIGEFKYKEDIEKLKIIKKEDKLKHIAFGFYHYHKYNNSKWLNGDKEIVNNMRRITMIYSNSFDTYKYPEYTPDLMLDGNKSTSWRIYNIASKEESTLTIGGWVTSENKIKILSGNHSKEEDFKKYYRPKKIKLSFFTLYKDKIVIVKQMEYILKDSKDFQTIEFNINFLDKLKNRQAIAESGNSFKLLLEIVSYYKGDIAHCHISELRI